MGRAPLQLLIQEDTHTHTHEAGGVGLSPHFQLSQLHHIVTELARWALKSPRALSVSFPLFLSHTHISAMSEVELRMMAVRAKAEAQKLLKSMPAPGNKRKVEEAALPGGTSNPFASPVPVLGSTSVSSEAAPEQPVPAGDKEEPPVEEVSGSPSQVQAEATAVHPPQSSPSTIHSVKDDLIFKLTDELPLKIMDGTTKQGKWASIYALLVAMNLADWPEDASPPSRTVCVHYLFQLRGFARLIWWDKEKKFTVAEFAPSKLNPPTPWSVTHAGTVQPPAPGHADDAGSSNEPGDVTSSVPVQQTTL